MTLKVTNNQYGQLSQRQLGFLFEMQYCIVKKVQVVKPSSWCPSLNANWESSTTARSTNYSWFCDDKDDAL